MRLQDLNWMDIERYLEQDDRIILVTGATEQHSYLSLLTDILIPSNLALAAAERAGVLIAPPLNFGVSATFAEFPGTISLSQETFDQVMVEVVESLAYQGFHKFFVLNGHGGNKTPAALLDMARGDEIALDWYNWWTSESVRAFEAHSNLKLNHANWGENFPFVRVAEVPGGEKEAVNLDRLEERTPIREVIGDGSFGGPYQVDDELMDTLFYMVVDEVVARLDALREG
jgi:creatinine amidohydrolase